MSKLELILENYVNKASDLAEAVKNNIKKNNKIDEKTVIALNEFIIAANEVSFLTEHLKTENLKFN